MKRRELLIGTVTSLPIVIGSMARPTAAAADRPPRLGLLAFGSLGQPPLSFLVEELAAHGYVDGRTITIEHPSLAGGYQTMQALAVDLTRSQVDILVTWGTTAARAAAAVTPATPIVAVGVDPIRAGFAENLALPGRNVTGIVVLSKALVGKRIELMREILPGIARIGVLLGPGIERDENLRTTEAAGRAFGIEILAAPVGDPGDIDDTLAALARRGAQGVLVAPSTMFLDYRAVIARSATRRGLAAIFASRAAAEAGGLVGYGPELRESFRRGAALVDKVLKGRKPSELPFEQSTKFELVINLKIARALGLDVPPMVLARADEVIE